MKKLVYFLCITAILSCNSQNANPIDPINPIKVEFKDKMNKISICYPETDRKVIVSIKLKINKALEISSVDLITARYKNDDNEMIEIKDSKGLIEFFNSKKFTEKINVSLLNEKFDNFPYTTAVIFPVYLKNCE